MKLECDGLEFKTEHRLKTTSPEWGSVLKVPVDGFARARVEASVWDHDAVGAHDFLGKVRIDLAKFADRKGRRKWRALASRTGERDRDRGRLELYIVWRHNPTLRMEVPRELLGDSFAFIDDGRFPPTELVVFAARAKALKATDTSLTGKATSDP